MQLLHYILLKILNVKSDSRWTHLTLWEIHPSSRLALLVVPVGTERLVQVLKLLLDGARIPLAKVWKKKGNMEDDQAHRFCTLNTSKTSSRRLCVWHYTCLISVCISHTFSSWLMTYRWLTSREYFWSGNELQIFAPLDNVKYNHEDSLIPYRPWLYLPRKTLVGV